MLEKKIIDTVEKLRFVSQNMPKVWNGRKSILEMKDANYKHWRRTEWLESYFKFSSEKHFDSILYIPGKIYGVTEFDAFREILWDFKTHAVNTTNHNIVTNDAEAIEATINNYGYYGIILAVGEIEYNDKDGTFKKWQNRLTLRKNQYETNKINGGVMSRNCKTEFVLSEIHFICLNNETLNQCSGSLQQGRNAAGNLKQSKVMLNISQIPNASLVATEIFYGKTTHDEMLQCKTDCQLPTNTS